MTATGVGLEVDSLISGKGFRFEISDYRFQKTVNADFKVCAV